MESRRTGNGYGLGLLAILILAIVVRLPFLCTRPMWFDEAYTWKLTNRFSWSEMICRTANDVHPPLDYLLSRLWQCLAGDSLIALRLPAMMYGALTILFVFAFAQYATVGANAKSATSLSIWAGGLCALLVNHVRWSQEARMYSLLVLLVVASSYFLWRCLCGAHSKKRDLVGYICTASLMLYVHNFGVFYYACQVAYVVSQMFAPNASLPVKNWRRCFLLAGTPFILYLPWLPVLIHQIGLVREGYWIPDVSFVRAFLVFPELMVAPDLFVDASSIVLILLGVVFFGTVAFACWQGNAFEKYLGFMILCPFILAIVVSVSLTPVLWPRYLLGGMVLFPLLVVSMTIRLLKSRTALIYLSMLAGLLVANVWFHFQKLNDRRGMAAITEFLRKQPDAEQPIVVTRTYLLFPLQYYLRHETSDRKVVGVTKTGLARLDGGSPLMRLNEVIPLAEMSELPDRIWVIDSNAWGYGAEVDLAAEWVETETAPFYAESPHVGWGHIRCREFHRTYRRQVDTM